VRSARRGRLAERKAFAEAASRLGSIDIGVNSAGVEAMSLLKNAPDHVAKMTAIQFNGAVHFICTYRTPMEDGGNLVNISSLTGMRARTGYIARTVGQGGRHPCDLESGGGTRCPRNSRERRVADHWSC
jgi:NAD(P)-dependent dehydrogenase (short-subunit alcohol dehydrogenase family)